LNVEGINVTAPEIKFLYLTQSLYFFGFYGLKSIFVLYAISHHAMGESQAIGFFATYMCLSYGLALVGSTIADRFLGVKNSILVGGVLCLLGTLSLIFLVQSNLFLGLTLLSVGTGLVKPNLIASTGLYFTESEKVQSDKAFSISYVAIQTGNMFAALFCGFAAPLYGWNYGIMLIGLSLLAGFFILSCKIRFEKENSREFSLKSLLLAFIIIATIIGAIYSFFLFQSSFQGIMGISVIASLLYLGWIFTQSNAAERKSILTIILSLVLIVLYGSLYEQTGSSMTLFIEKSVDRNIFGLDIPTIVFSSIGPVYTVSCSLFYLYVSKRYTETAESVQWLTKVAIGFVFVSCGFLCLGLASHNASSLISPAWLIGAFLLQTMGGVMICPTLFSTISINAPVSFKSTMMGFALMSIAYSHYVAGSVAQFSVTEALPSVAIPTSYGSFFLVLGVMPLIVGLSLFVYQRKRWA
jgi:proton-dependent oligopeptide transporter, POT family